MMKPSEDTPQLPRRIRRAVDRKAAPKAAGAKYISPPQNTITPTQKLAG